MSGHSYGNKVCHVNIMKTKARFRAIRNVLYSLLGPCPPQVHSMLSRETRPSTRLSGVETVMLVNLRDLSSTLLLVKRRLTQHDNIWHWVLWLVGNQTFLSSCKENVPSNGFQWFREKADNMYTYMLCHRHQTLQLWFILKVWKQDIGTACVCYYNFLGKRPWMPMYVKEIEQFPVFKMTFMGIYPMKY